MDFIEASVVLMLSLLSIYFCFSLILVSFRPIRILSYAHSRMFIPIYLIARIKIRLRVTVAKLLTMKQKYREEK